MNPTRLTLSLILSALLLGTTTACSSREAQAETASPTQAQTASAQTSNKKILIAYFTRAENTHVTNPAAIDVDAASSESLLAPGNVGQMAQLIQKETGGTLFSIHTKEPYPESHPATLDRASQESADGIRPALSNQIPDMETYDLIFLGYPNWDYGAPMAIRTFLESYDFSGKTVIPFCSHGTGGLSSSVRQIKESIPTATLGTPLGIYRDRMNDAPQEIHAWLSQIPL